MSAAALYAENQALLMRAMRSLLDAPDDRLIRARAEGLLATMDTPDELERELPSLLREQAA